MSDLQKLLLALSQGVHASITHHWLLYTVLSKEVPQLSQETRDAFKGMMDNDKKLLELLAEASRRIPHL